MAVDNARVREIIDDAIRYTTSNGASGCESIRQAWANLKAWRDQPPAPDATPNSLNLEVAAAENYMYARLCVCTGFVSRLQMNSIAIAYFATKVFGVRMPTSGNPQSTPDPAVLGWAGIGSEEGEADRERWNPTVTPPRWRPVNEIIAPQGPYQRALGTPGTSYTPPSP